MSPLPVSRRGADAFDDAVRTGTGSDARTAELLVLVGALRSTTAPEARPHVVAELRERLVRAAETELGARAAATPPAGARPDPTTGPAASRTTRAPVGARPARERRLAAALAGFALVGASATMAVAAQSALPGDTLYPLKRAIEDADTTLRADGGEGRRLLEHASSRLVELQQVSDPDRDAVRTAVLESTLDTFVEQAEQGAVVLLDDYAETGDPSSVVRVQRFAASSLQRLGRLEPVLPAAVRPELMEAAQVLMRIDAEADRACPECTGGGVVQVPSTLVAATTLDPDAAAPAEPSAPPAATPPGAASASPGRGPTRRPSASPSSRPAPAPQPPVDSPSTAPAPTDTRPTAPKPPVPAPTRDGLVEDLVDTLTGEGRDTDRGTPAPAPTPQPPDPGGLLGDPLGDLGSPTGPLLP